MRETGLWCWVLGCRLPDLKLLTYDYSMTYFQQQVQYLSNTCFPDKVVMNAIIRTKA